MRPFSVALASAALLIACGGNGVPQPASPSPTAPPEGTPAAVAAALPADCGSGVLLLQGTQAYRYADRDILIAASPSGDRTAFYQTDSSTGAGLYVGDSQGRNARRIADVQLGEQMAPPVWSPGGDRIAYESSISLPAGVGRDVFVVNADGSGNKRLTESNGFATTPSWSPDGTRLVYSSNADGDFEVFTVAADGSQRRQLTSNSARDSAASWSPDGEAIAFVSDRDGNDEVYVMRSDGSAQLNVSRSPGADIASPGGGMMVSWAPDGSKLVFMSDREGSPPKLYLVNKDGSGLARLTRTDALGTESLPLWSPNSQCIVFKSSLPSADPELYVVRTDGTGLQKIRFN